MPLEDLETLLSSSEPIITRKTPEEMGIQPSRFKKGVQGVKEGFSNLYGDRPEKAMQAGKEALSTGVEDIKRGTEPGMQGEDLSFGEFLKKVVLPTTAGITVAPVEDTALGFFEPETEALINSAKNTPIVHGGMTPKQIGQAIPDEVKQKTAESFKKLADSISPENKQALSDFVKTLRVFDFIPEGKIAEKVLGEVVEQAPKVARAVGEGVEKATNALSDVANSLKSKLKTSKEPLKEITKALDARTIEIFEAEQLAKEFGVELPASSFANPVKSKAEQIVGEGIFGGKIKQRAEKAITDFESSLSELQSKAPTSGELGEEIVNKFKSVEVSKKKVINDLYDEAERLIREGNSVYVNTEKTMPYLDDLIKRKRLSAVSNPSEISFLEKIKNGLANVNLDVNRATLKDIGDKANFGSFNPTTDEKLFRSLYGKLKSDIDSSIIRDLPNLSGAIGKANKAFSDFEKLKQRPFAKSIKKLGEVGDVDTLADKLTKTNISTNEAKQIYGTLGKDTTKKIQAKVLSDIIDKAKSVSGGVTAGGFTKQIQKIGEERLSALLSKDQLSLLKNIDKVNNLIVKGSSVARGSQTAIIQQITGALKGLAAIQTAGTSLLGEGILAKFFNSKAGQSFLKGIDKKTYDALQKAAQEAVK